MESILVISILAFATAAMVQFTAIEVVQQAVEAAAEEGVREAAKEYVTATMSSQWTDAVEESVNAILSVHGLMVDPTPGSGVRILLNDSNGLIEARGDPQLAPEQPYPPPAMNEFQVVLIVAFDPTAVNHDPLPNVLKSFCVDFSGKQFEAAANAKLE